LICTGGAEIRSSPTEASLGAATIPDANAPLLRALAAAAGIAVVGRDRTDDDPEALAAALSAAVAEFEPDAVVTSEALSAGKFEVVRQVLEAADPHAWFGHVDQQPGGPQGAAVFAGVPVICLPGNPVSTLVSFRLFVAPALGHVAQEAWARLGSAVTGITGREQFRRGRVVYQSDGTTMAQILGGAGSHLITQAVE